ncbi:MAG: D-alanine--D-alanine ligase [Pseudomonadales bacterium]|nr:D-alanine--D-alanine ligase [Pseudomonadales bacterium]
MNLIDSSKVIGNIAVLFGGESSEREVSLNSGKAVINAFADLGQDVIGLDIKTADIAASISEKNIKHVFIALHGGAGENGTVQALLSTLKVTYTGSSMQGCAIAMDKYRTKLIWQAAGIATADFMLVDGLSQWVDVRAKLGNKMMIKPANEGSSIGMSVVEDESSFIKAMAIALEYDALIIAEKWIEGNEYTVAIVAGVALPMIRLKTDNHFYDYEAKYETNDTQYIVPCGLDKDVETQIQQEALKAFSLLACTGWGRIDVMTNNCDAAYYFLEANTSPGMTDHSLVPMAAEATGKSFSVLVADIFNLSLA